MLKCSFCGNELRITTPNTSQDPCFRCMKCSVHITVSNSSYLPRSFLNQYWHIVGSGRIGKYDPEEIKLYG